MKITPMLHLLIQRKVKNFYLFHVAFTNGYTQSRYKTNSLDENPTRVARTSHQVVVPCCCLKRTDSNDDRQSSFEEGT